VRGRALVATTIEGYAEHTLGQLDDIPLAFREAAPGRFVADKPLPHGRWRLHVRLIRDGHAADFVEDVRA
jgi:hypothetical protein